MKRHARKAFTALTKMGAPVIESEDHGHFIISGESNDAETWADYWEPAFGEFGVNTRIVEVLRANGLFCEWINPGALGVYDA